MPPDESDRDCLESTNANPTLLFPTPKATNPDPGADPSDPAQDQIDADEAYQAVKDTLRDERREYLDDHRVRNACSRSDSERRRANAELLGALGSLLRPSPLENGFSSEASVSDLVDSHLDAALIAVLGEVRAMALDEIRGDGPGEGE